METVGKLIEFLKECPQDAVILSYVWFQDDAESIVNTTAVVEPVVLTDAQWEYISTTISNRSEWLHDGMHEEIADRYQDALKEGIL